MYHTTGTDGSIFPIGMPLIFLFSIGAIHGLDYSKPIKNLMYFFAVAILIFYYCTTFNPNRALNITGLFITLGYYITTLILFYKN